jgi:hypothetical protein
MHRKIDKRTGENIERTRRESGEPRYEAERQRRMRDVTEAINKGYRNKAIEEAFRK